MPILNPKLLLRLLAVIAVLAGGLVVLHHVQAGRLPEALLWQADAAAEKGRPDKAIVYLRQYLEFRPDDHDAAARLADLLAARAVSAKDVKNAQFVYERILREAPHRADVARKLIALCIRGRRYADALEHAQKLLERDRADGAVHAQVAECLVAQSRPDDARAAYEQAIALAPHEVRAYVQYANLLERHFKKPAEAGAILDRLIRANPNQPGAFLARARFLQRDGKLDDCLAALDQVFRLDPENGEALVLSAEVYQARGDLRRARETLRDAVAMYPRYAHGYRALSWLELMSGNQADALATLDRGVTALPDAADLLTPLGDLYVERGDVDRARAMVTRLESLGKAAPVEGRKPLALRASYLRGRLLMREGNWNEALRELETLRTDALGMPALAAQLNLLLAACHERRGDREAQVEALRRALALDPNHLAARVAHANALLNAGRLEDALKEYQTAARSPFAGLGVQMSWVSLRLAWARAAQAPDDEWKAIGTLIGKLREQHPEAVEPVALLAEWRAARGDFAGAEKVLREATAARPGDSRLWSALAGLLARGRGTLAAAAAVSQGQLAAGESVELRLARARTWADDLQPGREQRIAQLESLPSSAGDAERVALFSGLADVYATVGDDAGRTRVLAELAERDRQDRRTRAALYELALKAPDPTVRNRWREELQRADGPTGKLAALADALHAVQGEAEPDRALAEWHALAEGALAATPDQPDAHLLLARVAERRRDAAAAARHFEAATDLDPTSSNYQSARLGYFLRAGQDDAARRMMVRLEADPRLTPQRFRAVVAGAIRDGGSDALARCLTWLTPLLQREPQAAVWAGRLLEDRGKITDAAALYQQATEKFPRFADGWSARLLAAARVGEAEANEVTALAAKALDRPAFFALCAECGAAVRARAPKWAPPVTTAADRRLYAEACIAACEARGRLEDAVPVLTAIAQDTGSADAAWARRTLAALTAALGTPDRRREAIGALHGGDAPTSVADARSRVAALTVALRTVTGEDRRVVVREMADLLAMITRDTSATSNEWYQLAQLRAAAGDRAAARECLQELTRRDPRNLFYLSLVVDDLLSEDRLDDARPVVRKLEEGVRDARVFAAAARFHTLANEPGEVLQLTERFVRAADPGTVEGTGRQRQAAEVLDQLTRLAARKGLTGARPLLDAACERYRASLRAYPDAVAPLAALLSFSGLVDPAFEELDRQKTRLPATALATAGVGIVRTGRAAPKHVQTVTEWLESALAARPDSVPLKLNLAELRAHQGNYAAAEPVYRDVLKAEPQNLFALNNLAWILAARPDAATEALGLVDRAITLAGVSPEVVDTRARILIAAGQYDRAVADLTELADPGGSPLRYFHLALAYQHLGKAEEAARAFREARSRGIHPRMVHPEDVSAYTALAGNRP